MNCPKCGCGDAFILKELQKTAEAGQAYEILQCSNCDSIYKVYWKFEKAVLMEEKAIL